jgi:hypothetical protein
MQRCITAPVALIDIGCMADQRTDNCLMTTATCQIQRCAAMLSDLVDIGVVNNNSNSNSKRRKGSDGNDSGQSATTTIGNNENTNSLGINGSPDNGPVGLSSWLWLLVE